MNVFITSKFDLATWISNSNPGGVLTDPALARELCEVITAAADRPAWREDWGPWLQEHAASLVCLLTLTDDQIRGNRTAAAQHADAAQVALCDLALEGDAAARRQVARAITG